MISNMQDLNEPLNSALAIKLFILRVLLQTRLSHLLRTLSYTCIRSFKQSLIGFQTKKEYTL